MGTKDDAEYSRAARVAGVLSSLIPALGLLALLHRSIAATSEQGRSLDALGFAGVSVLPVRDWALLVVVAAGCVLAIVRKRPDWILWLQGASLGVGLMLTHLALGMQPGDHFDFRLLGAVWSGFVTLYASYLCLLAQIAFVVASRARRAA